jgi:hypothetical protein
LRKPRLVAIDGRDAEKAGQERQEGHNEKHRNRARMGHNREIDHGREVARGSVSAR